MATIQSFPTRQQHQHQSVLHSTILSTYYHFGLKTRTSRLFIWLTRLEFIYFVVLLSCVAFCFWPTLISESSVIAMNLTSLSVNSSLVMYKPYELKFAERCSVPITKISRMNFRSYANMNLINTILCLCLVASIILAQWVFKEISSVHFSNPFKWFCWCRKILIYLVLTSILHHLVSATACRPIEILFDIRYQSMIILQLVGFFICLLFSFFLGVKFASIKSRHRS